MRRARWRLSAPKPRNYGGDPDRIFLAGHSAGAYNAVMVASEPEFIAAQGGGLNWIRGVIGIAGPYNFLPMSDPIYVDMFHGTNNTDSMPVHHVDGPRPPMLLISGSEDGTVSLSNTNDMSERLKRFGSDVKVIFYNGVGHIGVILSLVRGFRGHCAAEAGHDRFHSRALMAKKHVLPDRLKPGLKLVFCGTAAGRQSALQQAYYAHGQNKFWKTLFDVGLTPSLFQPHDYEKLWAIGIGLTDIAKYTYGMDHQLPKDALGPNAVRRWKRASGK